MNPQDNNDKKDVTIIVNGRPKVVPKGDIFYEDVVRLAFPNPKPGPDFEYVVTYTKGHNDKEGTLTAGQSVKAKEGMIFNVSETNKS